MVLPTVSKTRLRLAPVLLGISAGYLASLWQGVLSFAGIRAALVVPWVDFPHRVPGWGWKLSEPMLLPFMIASLSAVLEGVGDITFCQKMNDAEWKRTDMKSASGGILTPGLCNMAAGIAGGIPHTTSSSAVGLTSATAVTSRSVAVVLGTLLVGLAFVPKLAAIFSVVPAPVMGAVMVYIACFITLGGPPHFRRRHLSPVWPQCGSRSGALPANVGSHSSPVHVGTVTGNCPRRRSQHAFRIGVARTREVVLSPEADNLDTG